MNRYIVILIIGLLQFSAAKSYGQSGWFWQNPKPTVHNLYAAEVISLPWIIAVGEYGTLLISSDNGKTWTNIISGTDKDLWGVSFGKTSKGIIVGDQGTILQTIDGGETWINKSIKTQNKLSDVAFLDSITIVVLGNGGEIYRSTNSGDSWTKQTSGTTEPLNGLDFINKKVGTVVGMNGIILRTTDGGVSWESQASGINKDLWDVSFSHPDTGTVVGETGTILRTSDGGKRWMKQTNVTDYDLRGVYNRGGNYRTIVGKLGIILRTEDDGATWKTIPNDTKETLWDVSFFGRVIVGEKGTVLQVENNATFRLSNVVMFKNLESVHFTDTYTGIAVGDNGIVIKTTDGGGTWKILPVGTTDNLYSVHFPDVKTGFAVGYGGRIINTTDGGSTWAQQTSGLDYTDSSTLWGVYFIDKNAGTAVGSNGIILRTIDGGNTWRTQLNKDNIYKSHNFYGVFFFNKDSGFAVGSNETILRTTDGGETWMPANERFNGNTGSMLNLKKIVFSNADTGMVIANRSGLIYRTADGGKNWVRLSVTDDVSFHAISSSNSKIWTAVGDSGIILHSIDVGNTWIKQSSWTNKILNGIYSIDSYNGVIVGESGVILRTLTGGSSLLNPPTPSFSIYPPSGTNESFFIFNASGSSDREDPPSSLMVRWDWQNDGIWDTDYTTAKIDSHRYNIPGSYTVKLEVKDTNGMINTITDSILVYWKYSSIITNDTARVSFYFGQTSVILKFESGNNFGKTIGVTQYDSKVPFSVIVATQFYKTLGYYNIESKEIRNFTAKLTFSYTDSILHTANINEKNLEIAYYYRELHAWKALPTTVDSVNKTVSTIIDHFSLWTITDKNEPLITLIENEHSKVLTKSYQLYQNYPNPFNPITTIHFQIAKTSDVLLKIYNIMGQELRTLVNRQLHDGDFEVSWDGKDNSGNLVSSGIYFCRIKAGNYIATKKMLLLK